MLRHHTKTALRNIRKHRAYSFISIMGLAIALTCCIIILMYVNHETSFDDYHQDSDRIYRIPTIVKSASTEKAFARGLTPLIPVLRKDFPEVEAAARFHYWSTSNVKIEYDGQVFFANSLMVTEPDLFSVFSIPFLLGDPVAALNSPESIVITRDIAHRVFADENPLGKSLKVNGSVYEITGVVENAPENTHLKYDIMLSLSTVETRMNMNNWGWTGFYSYVKLAPNADPHEFQAKIRTIAHDYIGDELDKLGVELIVYLQPLKSIHLHSILHREIKTPGNLMYVYIFSAVGILVLIVACINFMNLATARSTIRAKEVGVRKVMGAHRLQLVNQFVWEFFWMAAISLLLAMLMLEFILPYFNELSGMHLTTRTAFQPTTMSALLGLLLFVGLASGAYPAIFLSASRPAQIFNRFQKRALKGGFFRKVLVTWQFVISIALIISTLLIHSQIGFMKHQDLGFDANQKLIVPVFLGANFETIKTEFLRHSSITGATASSTVPGRVDNSLVTRLVSDKAAQGQTILYNFVDYDFVSEFGLEVIAGRAFQRDMTTDASTAFVVNEAAVKTFGFRTPEEALNKRLTRGDASGPIIGVVRDFHITGLQGQIPPHILQLRNGNFSMLTLSVSTEKMAETLEFIQRKWRELQLGDNFNYFFLDEDFNRQYASEERMGKLFSVFTILGISIAVLGLFGLASFTAEQRTKEIGIRKVLGATVVNVVALLSKDFLKLVLLANLVAWPVAYFAMNRWLQNFAYRTEISWEVFVLAGGVVLFIALLTVSTQAIRAALANPVHTLRYE